MYTPEFAKPRVLSVSQLNFYIKSLIENDPHMNIIFLAGEISNLTNHYRSGHIYLSLKDEKSVIKAVMFAGNVRNLSFQPKDGMKVICRGRVSLYETSGQYQLYIEDMQPDGTGALALAYDQLKNSLSEKGLFDDTHKKPIPKFPRSIGVVTSPIGAAVRDIMNILSRRFPCADIIMCPVLVQGDNASVQLVNAVNNLDKNNACDVIIIGRGGGSIEDLWAFNSEELAYAIYDCSIPVISAVGHETDYTICDFVSDLRAPTPSAAAELAVPDKSELTVYYQSQQQYLNSLIEAKLNSCDARLGEQYSRISMVSPQARISEANYALEKYKAYFDNYVAFKLEDSKKEILKISAKLEGLNPMSVLSRGFSVIEKNGKTVYSRSELSAGDEIIAEFSDGRVTAKVIGD